jgi:hypothetical protein
MNWYIESSRTEENYLKNVKATVEPCMNYICSKMFEISKMYEGLDNLENGFPRALIHKELIRIIDEMPVLDFSKFNTDDPYIRYNSNTIVKFDDSFKEILREIKLKQLLE